jgi:hypothetical protein
MNTIPLFVNTYTISTARVAVASERTGDTNYTLLVTAGPNGSKVDKINAIPGNLNSTSNLNKMLYYYIKNGSYYILIKEQRTPQASIGVTIYGWSSIVYFDGGLILPPGQELYVGMSSYTSAGDVMDFIAEVKNY